MNPRHDPAVARAPGPTEVPLAGTTRTLRRMGFGAMALSSAGRPERPQAIALIRSAVERGVDLIDTADVYALDERDLGHNERLVGEALRGMGIDPARGLEPGTPLVATKGGRTRAGSAWGIDGRPTHLRDACEASLRALAIERIPLYQLHAPDPAVPLEESVGAMARLREEGKIGLVGLSNVTVRDLERAERITPIASVQNGLSIWDAGFRAPAIVRACAARGIAFLAHSPLGGRGRAAALGASEQLEKLARGTGLTPQQLALCWLMGIDPVVVPLPGSTRIQGVQDAAAAVHAHLDGPRRRELNRAGRSLPGRRSIAGRVRDALSRRFGIGPSA